MGSMNSRHNAGVEEVDISTGNAYRYPPKSGNYFGSHFIMGGDRFETMQPECYLFGENQDLNFLGNRPIPFPYPAPQAHEPTKTLKSLVNIRKDSIRFIKASDDPYEQCPKGEKKESSDKPSTRYNVEFTFDTDVKCGITVYYFATEEFSNKHVVYHPKDPAMNSETFHYKQGANQTFSQTTHVIDPSKFPEEEWQFNPDKDVIPVVIHCVVEEEEHLGHSHMTFAIVEKSSDNGYNLKPLKQKQMVDGLCYLLQEIYGIENKNSERSKDDELDDNGSECVICMCEMRDTVILPCRHLCLCNCCADNLRYQANNCPICRAPFRALLQIRAMKKKAAQPGLPIPPQSPTQAPDEMAPSQEGVPAGFEAVSLIEALNGPSDSPQPSQLNQPPDGENPHLDKLLALAGPLRSGEGSTGQSPVFDKKKFRRNASGRSNRSNRSSNRSQKEVPVVPVEEAQEAAAALEGTPAIYNEVLAGGDGLRVATPETNATGSAPDASKTPSKTPSSPERIRTPKIRYPPAKMALDVSVGDQDNVSKHSSESVEIINEIDKEKPAKTKSDLDLKADVQGSATSPSSYKETSECPLAPQGDEPLAACPEISIVCPSYNTLDPAAVENEADRTSDCDDGIDIPAPNVDRISLPGTPGSPNNTDGSSYSSTSSSRGLLTSSSLGREEESSERTDVEEDLSPLSTGSG